MWGRCGGRCGGRKEGGWKESIIHLRNKGFLAAYLKTYREIFPRTAENSEQVVAILWLQCTYRSLLLHVFSSLRWDFSVNIQVAGPYHRWKFFFGGGGQSWGMKMQVCWGPKGIFLRECCNTGFLKWCFQSIQSDLQMITLKTTQTNWIALSCTKLLGGPGPLTPPPPLGPWFM